MGGNSRKKMNVPAKAKKTSQTNKLGISIFAGVAASPRALGPRDFYSIFANEWHGASLASFLPSFFVCLLGSTRLSRLVGGASWRDVTWRAKEKWGRSIKKKKKKERKNPKTRVLALHY